MLKQNKPLQKKTNLKSKSTLKANLKPKKQVKPKVSKLKKEADKYFSIATRMRFSTYVNSEYIASCVTCNVVRNIKDLQCGHFQSRRFNNTRYSEENCAPQCYSCNVMRYGEQFKFSKWLDDFYGDGTAAKLEIEAQTFHQFTVEELQQVIEDSKEYIVWHEKQQ